MIIAIDGLAGSGKSSTAKKVAEKVGYNYENQSFFIRKKKI